jgi:hypothetical protein
MKFSYKGLRDMNYNFVGGISLIYIRVVGYMLVDIMSDNYYLFDSVIKLMYEDRRNF